MRSFARVASSQLERTARVRGVSTACRVAARASATRPTRWSAVGGGAGGAAATIAQCAAGEVATGGGYAFSGGKRHALVTESRPNPSGAGQTPTGWFVRVETLTNDASNNTPVTTYAVCVSP